MSNADLWKTWEGREVNGKFLLRKWLGGSDHSAVFLTERRGSTPQKAAIKLIPTDVAEADRQLARWRAAAQLSHPNLIQVFESGRCELDGTQLLYVVMACAEEDLGQILPQRPLAPAEVSDLLPPLLDALSYLHRRGFVHGRVRPSNIMASGDQLKLSSDGLALPTEASPRSGRREVFDAPEMAAGISSPASDVWSVGVTIVCALTQNVSFAGDLQNDPILPGTIPEPFREIAHECLRVDPKRRCSVAELQARLRPEARSVPADREPTPEAAPRPAQRKPLIALLLIVAAVVGFLVLRSREKSAPTQTADTPATTQTAPTSASAAPARESAEPAKNAAASQGQVVHQVLPDVSRGARHTITGTVKVGVRVQVDSSGKVVEAKLTSPGPSKYFARLSLEAAQRWEFSPPDIDEKPSPSTWLLHFRFRRTSTEASSERVGQ